MTKGKSKFDKKCFLKILGIVLLFSICLFPYNYCSDIYNVIDVGYWEYAKQWFAPAGRTVGMGLLFFLECINLPIKIYIFIMKIFAVLIATVTIYIFYNMVLETMKYNEENHNYNKKCVFISVIITILNMASYQFFYYAESAIMWLGVLLTVLAVKLVIKENDKLRYLKGFMLLFIAMNCYQSTILFFIPAALLFLGIKKNKVRNIIFESIKLSIIVGICLLYGYIIIQGLTEYFQIIPFRDNNMIFKPEIILNVMCNLINQKHDKNYYSFMYLLINVISILGMIVISDKSVRNKKLIALITIFFIIMSAFLQTVGIIAFVDYYIATRIEFVYLATLGMNMLFFMMYTKIFDYKKNIKLCYLLVIVYLIYIILQANYISIVNRYVRDKDDEEGNVIAQAVENYEKTNNRKITQVIYCYDNYPNNDCLNVKHYGDPTFRIFAGQWVLKSALNYYTGKDLKVFQNQYIFEDIFKATNYDKFDKEQIQFNGNTMYLCIY